MLGDMVNLESLLAETQSKAAAWLTTYGVPTTAVSVATAQQLVCDAILEPFAANLVEGSDIRIRSMPPKTVAAQRIR